jgi:hypothetical protein
LSQDDDVGVKRPQLLMPVRARGLTEGNDGYLSASEIAGLKLDPD